MRSDPDLEFVRSVIHAAFLFLVIPCGLAMDWLVCGAETYHFFGYAAATGFFLPPIVFWIGDLVSEWRFRIAVRKEMDQAFQIVQIGKGLATRMIIIAK